MSKLTTRLQKLEQRRGGTMEFIIVYIDEGKVSREYGNLTHPELIGKTEAELDALYIGRDDIQVVKIVYASQTTDAVNSS